MSYLSRIKDIKYFKATFALKYLISFTPLAIFARKFKFYLVFLYLKQMVKIVICYAY